MFTDAYKGIPDFIRDCMESYIDKNDTYHNVSHKRRFARTLQVLLDQNPQGKLLELGTTGLVPMSLKTLAPELEVTVTDFDLEKDLVWKKKISINQEEHTFTAYSLDLEKQSIPCEDEVFDYVLCCEVIEHMEIDPMHLLSEINRVMKPGGMLIVTTPNIASSWGITKILSGIEPYFYMQYQKTGSGYHRHNYEHSVHSLAATLKAAGFDGSVWTEDSFENPTHTVIDKLKNAGFNLNHLGDNIFSVAQKKSLVRDRYPKEIYV